LDQIDWQPLLAAAEGLSQADIARAADEAAKVAVLMDSNQIAGSALTAALRERKAAAL